MANTDLSTPSGLISEWARYKRQVYPDGMTSEQEEHCRQCFFAGMASVFGWQTDVLSAMPDDDAINHLEGHRKALAAVPKLEHPELRQQP